MIVVQQSSNDEPSTIGMLRPFYMMLLLRLAIEFVLILTFLPSCVPSKQRTTTNTYPQPLHGIDRDPFVENAPLVIAVACRDGVAIVAATEPSSGTTHHEKLHYCIIDSEPLLYYNASEIKEMVQKHQPPQLNGDTMNINNDNDGYPFLDLPDTYAGPYRIQSLTSDGRRSPTFYVSCGWKVDGYIHLRNAARDMVNNERYTFGIVDDKEISITLLANQISLYMAQCAVSERVSFFCKSDQIEFVAQLLTTCPCLSLTNIHSLFHLFSFDS